MMFVGAPRWQLSSPPLIGGSRAFNLRRSGFGQRPSAQGACATGGRTPSEALAPPQRSTLRRFRGQGDRSTLQSTVHHRSGRSRRCRISRQARAARLCKFEFRESANELFSDLAMVESVVPIRCRPHTHFAAVVHDPPARYSVNANGGLGRLRHRASPKHRSRSVRTTGGTQFVRRGFRPTPE